MPHELAGRVESRDPLRSVLVCVGTPLLLAVMFRGANRVGIVACAGGSVLVALGSGVGQRVYIAVGSGNSRSGQADVSSHVPTSPLVGLLGVVLLVAGLLSALGRRRPARGRLLGGASLLVVFAAGATAIARTAGEVSGHLGWIEGRPRRRHGRRVPIARPAAPDPAAQRWLRIAQEEHASVGAFLDLAARLERIGAPPGLVTRCP